MNLLARRERDHQDRRERELIDIRDSVVAAMPNFPNLGSSPISEAVDEALDQLRASGNHLAGDIDDLKKVWILYAKRRLIDRHRSAASKRRDPVPVDEHTQALTVSSSGDPSTQSEDERDWARTREIVNQFRGDDRVWVELFFDKILAGETQPRGIAEILDWHPRRTETVSRRVRAKIVAFVDHRHNGAVCSEKRQLLDSYAVANATGAGATWAAGLGEQRFEALAVHLAGCEDCSTAWHLQRRTTVLRRVAAAITLPFGQLAGLAHALRAKLDTFAAAAHSTSHSLRQRLGIGGGAGAAVTGGGVATISGKAAAICGAVVCAAGAAGGAVVEAVPSLLPPTPHRPAHHTAHHATRSSARATQPAARLASYTPATVPTTPAPATPAPPTPPAPTAQQSYTPGDLPPASSQPPPQSPPSSTTTAQQAPVAPTSQPSSSTTTRPVSAPRTVHAQPACTPGDLAC